MREFVIRRKGDRLFQRHLCGLEFAAPEVNDAKIGKRIQIVRRFGQDFLINLFRGAVLALVEILLGLPGKIDNVRRHVRFEHGRHRVTDGTARRRCIG